MHESFSLPCFIVFGPSVYHDIMISILFVVVGYLSAKCAKGAYGWSSNMSSKKQQELAQERVFPEGCSLLDVLDADLWLDDLASTDTEALLEEAMHAQVEKELVGVSGRCIESALNDGWLDLGTKAH